MEKRGQVTIFIIIAVIVISVGILIYMYYPRIVGVFPGQETNPSEFLQNCIEDDIQTAIDDLSLKGGSIDPEHYIVYEGSKIEYLCYTNEYYKTCVMQQPLLKKHVEGEIEKEISAKAKSCLDELEKNVKSKGYQVNFKRGDVSIELLPKRVALNINGSMSLTKNGESSTYSGFRVFIRNNLYELVSITNSILNWEARYGDSETTTYMNYYHDLKVEKLKQGDGSTIYILTDRNNGNKFQFASRSVAWPPGFAPGQIQTA